ncbi:MAG: hypothetical protein Q8W49_06215 [Candidatus Palauibacterales bacterium]|nr:hypothetical protein [Candidatus Palauibacterales bacterium]
MTFDQGDAATTTEYRGRIRGFCCQSRRRRFEEDLETYADEG